MKKLQTLFLGALIAGSVFSANAMEKFSSSGFSFDFAPEGRLLKLTYAGTPLVNNVVLNGEYTPPAGKIVRLFQSGDPRTITRFEKEKGTLSVDSVIGTPEEKDVAKYKVRGVFTPDKISLDYEVTLCREIISHGSIFRTLVLMPESLFGSGVKETTFLNEENFKVLPEKYEKKFILNGKKLSFGIEGKGVFTFETEDKNKLAFMDSRAWGGKDFSIVASPKHWTAKPVVHPPGTIWKWSFTLTFQAEK